MKIFFAVFVALFLAACAAAPQGKTTINYHGRADVAGGFDQVRAPYPVITDEGLGGGGFSN